MKTSINIDKDKQADSFWIEVKESNGYTKSSDAIEINNVDELVESILSEFNNTPDDLIPTIKQMLKEWLLSMQGVELDELNTDKVRDFIYEMF